MVLPILFMLTSRHAGLDQSVNVFAAASLKEAIVEIAASFEKLHPKVKVNLNFGGSQLLAAQINGGAPADVFASADQRNLDKVEFIPTSRKILVRNELAVVTRSQLISSIALRELPKLTSIVIADESVPVGKYTEDFFTKASRAFGVEWLKQTRSKIVSKELDVKAVLAKVKLGEADAGIVYVSDAFTAGKSVHTIAIPKDLNVIAEYPVAIPTEAPNPAAARAFLDFLFTKDSQRVFNSKGFITQPQKLALHKESNNTRLTFVQ